jgi:hypothetical protein
MAKHAGKGKGNAVHAAKKIGKGTAITAAVTAKGVRATAKATATTLNFCLSPLCLHDSRTAKCTRKCCS